MLPIATAADRRVRHRDRHRAFGRPSARPGGARRWSPSRSATAPASWTSRSSTSRGRRPGTARAWRSRYRASSSSTAGRLQLANQEVEVLRSDEQDLVHTGRITPVHPATEGISPRTIRELVWRALEQLPPSADPMPGDVRAAEALVRPRSGPAVDPFPGRSDASCEAARERLKFDELFTLELGVGVPPATAARPSAPGWRTTPTGPLTRGARAVRCRSTPTDAQRPRDGGGRPAHGGAAADEPAAPGRRRVGQDARRAARVSRRDPVGAPGGDHGADGGPGRPAPALGGRAPRSHRRTGAAVRSSRGRASRPTRGPCSGRRRQPRRRSPTRCCRAA